MTTQRRKARAQLEVAPMVDGHPIPAELFDPDHPVWADRARYREFLAEHGLDAEQNMPPSERFNRDTHPHNRRNYTSMAWAVVHGVTDDDYGHADLHTLRAMGLYG